AAPYVSTICATPLRLYSCRRDSGTTAIYTLSLHDALPISGADQRGLQRAGQFLKVALQVVEAGSGGLGRVALVVDVVDPLLDAGDRKSTRLNSSHVKSSYADFCLKKKRSRDEERPQDSIP